jgi:RHS repeat-associated protein
MTKARSSSALSRCFQALRRWFHDSWLDRLPIVEWLRGCREWLFEYNGPSRSRKPAVQLEVGVLERREVPNDIFGLLGTPLAFTGLTLLNGNLLTPVGVLARGWSGGMGLGADSDPAPTILTAPASRTADDELATPFASHVLAVSTADPGVNTAPATQPVHFTNPADFGGPALGADPFRSPFDNGFLNAIGAALNAAQTRPAPPTSGSGTPAGTGEAGSSTLPNSGVPSLPPAPPYAYPGDGSSDPAFLASLGGSGAAGRTPSLSVAPAGDFAPASSGITAAAAPSVASAPTAKTQPPPNLAKNYGQSVLPYELNVGQTDSQVRFLSHGPGFGLFLTGSFAEFAFARPSQPTTQDVVRMQFAGANANAPILAEQELSSRANYFVGSDPTQWHADVPEYAQVRYKGLYPGVDLVYHSAAGRQMEYDFEVAPGASVANIHLGWQGTQSLSLDTQGNLVIQTAGGKVVQQAPVMYQMVNGVKQTVTGRHVLIDSQTVGFQVDSYDATKPLIIDPVVSFATLLGGSGDDKAFGVAVGPDGSTYLTGSTTSTNFPTSIGAYAASGDSFVSKFDPTGQNLVYSTYLSTGGQVNGIAADPTGDAYVVGNTTGGLTTTAGAYQTSLAGLNAAFLTKLNATGDALLYSTYLGGQYRAYGNAIAVNVYGNAYLTGATDSPDFPTTAGVVQPTYGGKPQQGGNGFVTEFNTTGTTLVYSTFLGGRSNGANDAGAGIALDAAGDAYVTGSTNSANFPTTLGAYQTTKPNTGTTAFVAELNPTATTLVYSTFLGGSTGEAGNAIAVDRAGSAYVSGQTTSTNFPTASAFQSSKAGATGASNAFVTKLTATGATLVYSSYLGGGGDTGYGIAVDAQNEAFLVGTTPSSTFPTYQAFQTTNLSTLNNAFVTKLTSTGTLAYSSLLGGATVGTMTAADNQGRGIGLDAYGNAYVDGYTNATNFPTTSYAYQQANAGGYDAFLAKVAPLPNAPQLTTLVVNSGATSIPISQPTTYTNFQLEGLAPAGATVTLYRAGIGQLGSVAANGSGVFTYAYSVSGEGTYDFTATDTVNNITSLPSAPDTLVTVDLTAPTVTVVAPASTYSTAPQVIVQASDLNGLPDGTAVTLKVDVNRDNMYSGSATGTLFGGYATLTSPALGVGFSYNMKAQVTDRAGNQGISPVVSVAINAVPGGSVWATTGAAALTDPLAGDAMLQVGNLRLSHPLDLDTSPGTASAGNPALTYNSAQVAVKPVVQATIQSDNSQPLPSSFSAALTWNGTQGATYTYDKTGASPGDLLTLAIQEPTTVSATGAVPWSITVVMNYGTPITKTASGTAYVVTQDSSPFGAGWGLSSLDQLVPIVGSGVLYVYGTGMARFWAGTTMFTTPPTGDNGTLTLSGGVYTYTTPTNEQTKFNSNGYETSWTSGDGLSVITFTYDGSNRLSTVTAIDGTTSTFTYNSGLLSTIKTSNNRTTSFAYDGSNNLTQITNPDGGLHTFAYDGSHHLTGETFGLLQNVWNYGGTGALASYTWGSVQSSSLDYNPSTFTLNPAMVQGLGTLTTTSTFAVGDVYATQTNPPPVNYPTKTVLDAQGRPLKEVARDGGITRWFRDGNGWVTALTDALNRTTSYALDAQGFTTQTTNPDGSTSSTQYQSGTYHLPTQRKDENGNTTTYTYDGLGHLKTIKDALSEVTSYAYDAGTGEQTAVTDPLNHTTSYAYDAKRRLTTMTDALSNVTSYSYDNNGNPLTTTDARGNVTTYAYDVMSRLTQTTDVYGSLFTQTYDVSGLQLTSTDALGHQTSIVYNRFHQGLVAQTLEAVGTPVQISRLDQYDNAGRVIGSRNADGWSSSQTLDPKGQVTQTTDPLGNKALMVYDLAGQTTASRDVMGRLTQSVYDNRGRVIRTIDALGDIATNAYDQVGNLTAATDALNHTTTYQYDALNRQIVVTDALSHSATTTYDAAGNTSTVTDQLSHVTSYAYDAVNRTTTITRAVGTAVQQTTQTGYDKVGNATTQTDALNHTTTFAYDNLNRQIAVTDALGHTTTTAYDKVGNATTVTDALSKMTSYAFDARNRQLAMIDPLGHVTTSILDADGNSVASIDPLGDYSVALFDMLERSVGSVDMLGALTQTWKDAAGNTAKVIDPDNNQTVYLYDALNREILRTDPTGAAVTTAYDADGNVTSVIDRDNRQVINAYDAANRLTGVTWKATPGGSTVNLQTFTYDAKGNLLTAADNLGTIGTVGTITRSYDELDRLKSQTDVYGLTLTYSYDAADRQTQMQDSKGGILTSVYDNANRLTSRQLSVAAGTVRVDPVYTNRNELSSLTRYSDVAGTTVVGTTVYAYDDHSRVTSITSKNGTGGTLSYYNYNFNNADLVTQETWSSGASSGTHTYAYDRTNQLTADGTTPYSYDGNGNRTNTGYQTGTDNRLSNDGTFAYTYDAAGNLTQKSKGSGLETWYFTYDTRNLLTSVRQTSDGNTYTLTLTYTYDALGDRVRQDKWQTGGSTVTTRLSFGSHGNVWAELDTNNNVQVRYVWGDATNQLFARIDTATEWALTDRLGTVRDIVSAAGTTILDHVEYGAFGNIVTETSAINGGNVLFQGEWQDRDAGIVDAFGRTILVTTGRWLQQDPILFRAGDPNLYRVVGNNPTNKVDPSGLQVDSISKTASTPSGAELVAWAFASIGIGGAYAGSRPVYPSGRFYDFWDWIFGRPLTTPARPAMPVSPAISTPIRPPAPVPPSVSQPLRPPAPIPPVVSTPIRPPSPEAIRQARKIASAAAAIWSTSTPAENIHNLLGRIGLTIGLFAAAVPGFIPQAEIQAVEARWKTHPGDPGIGIYNIVTGEMHVSTVSQEPGHPNFVGRFASPPYTNWRGFGFVKDRGLFPQSSLNLEDKIGNTMAGRFQDAVEQALKAAKLID